MSDGGRGDVSTLGDVVEVGAVGVFVADLAPTPQALATITMAEPPASAIALLVLDLNVVPSCGCG
jgi:hypothetical protein